MKRILIRTGFTPFENISVEEMLSRPLMGGNIGNSVYAYGVFRTLMTSDQTEFRPTRYMQRLRDIDEINETCSRYIIPLADMFRQQDNSIPHMEQMAKFIRKLKIPCTIVGVGVRASIDSHLKGRFSFQSGGQGACISCP